MALPLATLFGPENWIVIALVALLLFGRRLPEVGRSLGKGIIEFKKGLQGIEEDINTSGQTTHVVQTPAPRQALPTGYKFDPFTGKPLVEEPASPAPMKFDPYTGKPLDRPLGEQAGATQSTSSNT
jgi:sec-independent protein translocase protein TatA